ncbi:MAG: GrpB family protein [Nanoarchaeota archaeon]|nr:GrpB family protein [Nanoarchaeota archaeon]
MGKYIFKSYDSHFKKLFSKEKSKLKKILPNNTKIEHVGSTAVTGLGGKGIIDIAIKTPRNKLNQFMNKLERLGYVHTSEHQPNNKRIFFQKIIRYKGKERRIHIHLTLDEDFLESFIVVRDYLRSHDKECKKYAKIKKEAVKYAKGEGKKYREYKDKFLKDLLSKAIKDKSKNS